MGTVAKFHWPIDRNVVNSSKYGRNRCENRHTNVNVEPRRLEKPFVIRYFGVGMACRIQLTSVCCYKIWKHHPRVWSMVRNRHLFHISVDSCSWWWWGYLASDWNDVYFISMKFQYFYHDLSPLKFFGWACMSEWIWTTILLSLKNVLWPQSMVNLSRPTVIACAVWTVTLQSRKCSPTIRFRCDKVHLKRKS